MSAHRGFTRLSKQIISEYNIKATTWIHTKTKAKLITLENDDPNNVFSICFRTPVKNSTGVAHILEHSVLAGSKKYPLKEPFVHLLKGSLYTFLNAFTYPDRTCYPVASQNSKDFYNLIDVYLDATLNPLLKEKTFSQEGWHYQLQSPEEPLSIKGVVYNEMKGAYSDPEGIFFDAIIQNLFDKNCYRFDSGGDPSIIPTLTYEDFKSYHESYYHPSNSYVFFYGNDTSDRKFEIVDEYFSRFDHKLINSSIHPQPSEDRSKHIEKYYDPGLNSTGGYIAKNWLTDTPDSYMLMVLNELLLGHADSPLYKALIESGLGDDITPSGFESFGIQPFFTVGLKNVSEKNYSEAIKLIENTLISIRDTGFSNEEIEAAINSIEFRLRELNTGNNPRGLSIMTAILEDWIYDKDPIEKLRFSKHLQNIKAQASNQPNYFGKIIDELLISNKQFTTLTLTPRIGMNATKEKEEQKKLKNYKDSLTEDNITQLINKNKELQEYQTRPESTELINTIPHLTLDDLKGYPERIESYLESQSNSKILYNSVDSNGLTYIHLGFNLEHLQTEDYVILPFIERALQEFDTPSTTAIQRTTALNIHTGNFTSHIMNTVDIDGKLQSYFIISGKALNNKIPKLLEILKDLLNNIKTKNKTKIEQFIKDTLVDFKESFVTHGNKMALMQLKSQLNISNYLDNECYGVNQYNYLKKLAEKEELRSELQDNISKLVPKLFNKKNLIVSVTEEKDSHSTTRKYLEGFINDLRSEDYKIATHQFKKRSENYCFLAPTKVNYNCLTFQLPPSPKQSYAEVINHLNFNYLWNKIRVIGGAYGCNAQYSPSTGIFSVSSYRDPRSTETFEDYQGIPDFLGQSIKEKQLLQCITGAIGSFDHPMLPEQKGYATLIRYIQGKSYEDLRLIRNHILSTGSREFNQLANILNDLKLNQNILKATVTNYKNADTYQFDTNIRI